MKKRRKKISKAMQDKVTITQFFSIQLSIIKELYGKYKFQTTVIIGLSSLTIAASYLNLKFTEYATNGVSAYINHDSGYNFTSIILAFFGFLSALLFFQLIQNINNKLKERYISEISFAVEQKITDKLSSISYEWYENNAFHEKINHAKQASEQYHHAIYGVSEIIRISVMIIVYGIMLAKINLFYVLVIFLAIVISSIFSVKVTDQQLDYWRTYVSPESRRQNYFSNILGNRINQQNIQTNRTLSFFIERLDYYIKREKRNYLKLNTLSFTSELATSVLFMITFFLTAVLVGQGVATGEYQIGYYAMVIALLANMFTIIKQFAMFMLNGNWYVKVLLSYYDIIALSESSKHFEAPGGQGTENKGLIKLNNIKYSYPQSEKYALKGVNGQFRPGEKIAIVGHNGSGKTTLISIILRLLSGYQGEYEKIKVIPTAILQDFGQYQMTVKENIELGCGGNPLSDDQIINILKRVELDDFIANQPAGIHTNLGQLKAGVELSKGQWQRLAIARLLAQKDANVWILDEPTAYLDPIAEIEMYQYIFSLAEDRLVLFISHRLGFAKNADRIIVIAEGMIVQDGTHRELINTNGLYQEMYMAQKDWYR